ncbi:MAG: DEAD/DEAH box helicase [Bacilli bacterium]|nr:DEAD/DEAH box helicase [Bacilli bacterium]
MLQEIDNIIKNVVSEEDYNNGLLIDEDDIILMNTYDNNYNFIVKEDRKPYIVRIVTQKNDVKYTECTCIDHQKEKTCKHVAACLITYSNKLFNFKSEIDIINKTKELFKIFNNDNSKKIKKECFLELTVGIDDHYYYYYRKNYYLKIKIGTDKLYSLTSKYNAFMSAFKDGVSEVAFGKSFVYKSDEMFFNDINSKIIDFIDSNCNYHYNTLYINEKDLKKLLNMLKDTPFYIDNLGFIEHIKTKFPFKSVLEKEDNNYRLALESGDYYELFDDLEYIYYQGSLYHLNKKNREFLHSMNELGLDKLVFDEKDFNSFTENLLPIFKDNLALGAGVEDLNLDIKAEPQIYFDMTDEFITANLKFKYNEEEVDYHINNNTQLIRDYDFENSVVNDLLIQGFIDTTHEFVIEDLERMVSFLEKGLKELSNKYQIFTTKKIKNTKLVKKAVGSTTFSIGTDNILSYNFELNDIDKSELDKVIESLRLKKKYYRLKNGNIVDLQDDSLNQLSNLMEDLDIDGDSGVIPKYRAIYLDSLKKEKYSIIKTNNLFDNFIDNFKKYQDSEVEFTKDELKLLRDYQVTGVKWLYNITKCDLGGILADEMGLGKSLQTIIYIRKLLQEDKFNKFLIVVPTSLLYNWQNEFQKFAPEINVVLVNGEKEKRTEILNEFKHTVYVTTYGLARIDIDLYKEKQFRVCIIDEAQNIKNPTAGITKAVKEIPALTKLALTGTPIENSVIELWSIFDFIMPGILNNKSKFNSKYVIKDFDEESLKTIDDLNKQVHPFILRRKKSDVLKDLPPKIENNIYVELNEDQKKIYTKVVKETNEKMNALIKESGFLKAKFMILQLLTRLRQICIDPKIVYENYNGRSSKIDNLIKVVHEVIDNGHKILLFTSFKTALNIVKAEFDKEGITSYTIAGDVAASKRQQLVEQFNKDDTNVFLIMLKSGGTGLNLTSADVVIHLDLWWNPQAENQATDRTHRIGQKNTVEVIKIISKGTIEEKIADLQAKKKMLSDKIIDADESTMLDTLSEEDIRTLLSFEQD